VAEFERISTLADVALQDDQDVSWGFAAGLRGDPEPLGSVYSRAYWHGWRAGRVTAGDEPDAPQRLLAHAFESTYGGHEYPLIV
jgi:hypothetical protein